MKRYLACCIILCAHVIFGIVANDEVDACFLKKSGGRYQYERIAKMIDKVGGAWKENPSGLVGVMSNLYSRILQMSIPTNAFTTEMWGGLHQKRKFIMRMVDSDYCQQVDAIFAWADYMGRVMCAPTNSMLAEFHAAVMADEINRNKSNKQKMNTCWLACHKKWRNIQSWNALMVRYRKDLLNDATGMMKWRIGFLRGDAVKAEDLDLIFSVAMRAHLNDEEMKILFDQNETELTAVIADLSPEEKERLLKILEGKSTEPEARALAYYQRLLALPILPEQDQADRLLVCKRQAIQKFLSRDCCMTNDVAVEAWADFVGRLVPVSTNLMVEKFWPVEALKDGAKGRRQTVQDLQTGARRWRAIKHWNGCIARHRRIALADAEPWVRRRLGSLEKSNPSAGEAFMQRLKSRARLTEKECEQLFAQPRRNGL